MGLEDPWIVSLGILLMFANPGMVLSLGILLRFANPRIVPSLGILLMFASPGIGFPWVLKTTGASMGPFPTLAGTASLGIVPSTHPK